MTYEKKKEVYKKLELMFGRTQRIRHTPNGDNDLLDQMYTDEKEARLDVEDQNRKWQYRDWVRDQQKDFDEKTIEKKIEHI